VISALGHGTHMLYFSAVNHGVFSFLERTFFVLIFFREYYNGNKEKCQ